MSELVKRKNCINPAYLFGHRKNDVIGLFSMISVKELCLKNKDAFAAGLIIYSVYDSYFDTKNSTDYYIKKAAISFSILDDVEKCKGYHKHICEKPSFSCPMCIYESRYIDGLFELSHFETVLSGQSDIIKNELKRFDNTCILFMTICQMQEIYWFNYSESLLNHVKFDFVPSEYDKECPEYEDSLNDFLIMSKDNQNERYERMKKIREYIENPYKINNIWL